MADTQSTQVNANLAALLDAGVSPWLDQIRRDLIHEGELERLVREDSLRGMTSNPAIFEKAIMGADLYDELIEEKAQAGDDARDIYRAIAIRDVQDACDVLRSVYDETGGYDGYVSLEVDPDLADDTDRTIEQAKLYWKTVDRPNVMIKIPGTDEGVPAIEEATAAGINVNVTLLFAVESYANIAEAYIKGLERRKAAGESVDDVHSVASFFVSRVDTEVDKRLKDAGADESLLGIAGLANARAAYVRFKELFHGERFAELLAAGAPVQRPLWASTGVKDERYPDTLYIDGLVAPETVNTMPMDTLQAAADHGEVTGATADADPTADLDRLRDAGIDLTDVTQTLLHEGIDKFVTPMEDLLAGIEAKRLAFLQRRPAGVDSKISEALGTALTEAACRAEQESLATRIWDHDDTVWGEKGQPEVSDRLGWLDIADRVHAEIADLEAFAADVRGAGMDTVVLLGMGGSSLFPEVLRRSFPDAGGLTLHVLDSTDAAAVGGVADAIDVDRTLFLVSTKSGGTIETLSAFETFHARQPDGGHFVAITDPGSPLVAIAERHGFRRTFLNDANIGGRYSALSYFGTVPAALLGVDLGALLGGAVTAAEGAHADKAQENPALWLGLAIGALAQQGRDKLTFVVDEPLASFGLWVEQLVAESTGKHGKGVVPIAGEPLGDPGDYGDDRVFVHIHHHEADAGTDHDDKLAALADAGHPVLELAIEQATDLGRLCFESEFAIAVVGWVLGINPFDQPNVAEAKDATKKVLKGFQDDGALPEADEATDEDLRALLDGAGPPHYVAVMGYVAPADDVDAAVEGLRLALRTRTGAATTFGYGPRFLHSTGQLHKGGAPNGRFLQLTTHEEEDIPIPETTYGFETLKAAQALGDLRTLQAHDLPVARVTLAPGGVADGVRALADRIAGL